MQTIAGPAGDGATPAEILAAVADHFGLSPADLIAPHPSRDARTARQTVLYLCGELTDLPERAIAAAVAGADRSMVRHAQIKLRGQLAERLEVRQRIADLTERLGHRD